MPRKAHPELAALGSAIRRRRKRLGIAQEELAHRCGIDRSHMGAIERGETNITLLNLLKVADSLEIKPSSLLASYERERAREPAARGRTHA